MSYDLRIWEQPAGAASPATLEDAGRTVLALEGQRTGVNPKFVALGRKMSERFSTASAGASRREDAVWMSDPAAEAQALDAAVWVVSIPSENRVPVTFFVVETATSLGLSVLDDQLGMAFLPGGKVLPEEKSHLWNGLRQEMARNSEPRVTKADMRKALATFLRESVVKHGFQLDRTIDRADVGFARSTPAGRQTIEMTLNGAVPELECTIYCIQRNDDVESVYDAVFGPATPPRATFAFTVGAFTGHSYVGIPFKTAAEIKAIFALLEEKALPLMEVSASMSGLNDLMNRPDRSPLTYPSRHPLAPESLAQRFRLDSPRPLIVAWMVGDPDFDRWVDEYRALMRVEKRSRSESELDRLLAFLRDRDRPVGEGRSSPRESR